MYTGTMIEDLIHSVEVVEQRAHTVAVPAGPMSVEAPIHQMNWQDWQELVEVA